MKGLALLSVLTLSTLCCVSGVTTDQPAAKSTANAQGNGTSQDTTTVPQGINVLQNFINGLLNNNGSANSLSGILNSLGEALLNNNANTTGNVDTNNANLLNGLLNNLSPSLLNVSGNTGVNNIISQLLGNAGVNDIISQLLGNAGVNDVISQLLGNAGFNEIISQLLGNALPGLDGPIISLLQGALGNATTGTGQDLGQTLQGLLSQMGSLASNPNTKALYTLANVALMSSGVGEECREDLFLIVQGLLTRDDWALALLDSMGKLESQILELKTKYLGSYEQCTRVDKNVYNSFTEKNDHFVGKYCRLIVPLDVPGMYKALGIDSLTYGSCVSSKCSASDIQTLLVEAQKLLLNGTVQVKTEVSCVEERTLGTDAIVCICLLSMLLAFVVFGTLYDVIAVQMKSQDNGKIDKSPPVSNGKVPPSDNSTIIGYKPTHSINGLPKPYTNGGYIHEDAENGVVTSVAETKLGGDVATAMNKENLHTSNSKQDSSVKPMQKERGTVEKILLAFSLYTNGVKILNTDQAAGTLGAVNGIRFLSMAWVILGHTFFFCLGFDANGIPFFARSLDNWTFMAIPYATVSVDSFFALSGILVAYLTLKELKKVGGAAKINWFMFYFHRFWRLTPPYMLVLMVGTVLLPYFISGPMAPEGDMPFMGVCRESWWANLLYVNNYVSLDKICMGWSWYLSNDMQFYIISPIILLPLFYNAIAGVVSCLIFLTASTISIGIIAYKHHYPVQRFSQFAPPALDGDYDKLLYFPSYARMGPYIVGLFTGYMLYRTSCKLRIPKVIHLILWFLSISTCLLVVYSLYTDGDSHILTREESAAFLALHRTGWGIAVCWIVFACANGYGGWINQILSWKGFIPLGRLTYSAYLIHPLIMLAFYTSRPHITYFNNYEIIYLFLGHMCMAYGIGFIVSLLFESPMMGLEKAIFNRKKKHA